MLGRACERRLPSPTVGSSSVSIYREEHTMKARIVIVFFIALTLTACARAGR
jgi:hypothetical protein